MKLIDSNKISYDLEVGRYYFENDKDFEDALNVSDDYLQENKELKQQLEDKYKENRKLKERIKKLEEIKESLKCLK